MLLVDIPPETHQRLRLKAAETRQSMKYLVDLFIRFGLDRVSTEALMKRPEEKSETGSLPRGRLGGHRWESAILNAYERLLEREAPTWRFTVQDFVAASGLYPSEALKGLRGLQDRGLMESVTMPDQTGTRKDADGNPVVVEYWNRPRKRLEDGRWVFVHREG